MDRGRPFRDGLLFFECPAQRVITIVRVSIRSPSTTRLYVYVPSLMLPAPITNWPFPVNALNDLQVLPSAAFTSIVADLAVGGT